MKTKALVVSLLVGLSGMVSFLAAGEVVGGPRGGRLLPMDPLSAEFFVTADGRAEITFYDATMKPVAPAPRVVSLTAEPKSGRVAIELDQTETGFISKHPLPDMADPYRVVVQIRDRPDARPKNFRIELNLEKCGGCQRSEYACTCGH